MSLTVIVIVVGKFLVFAGLVSAAASDLARRIIPNWLVLTVGGGGVMVRLATANWHGVWASVGAAGILFVVLRLLSGFGVVGGGDVKLVAAVALGQPVAAMPSILLGIGVAGGGVAMAYLIRERTRTAGQIGQLPRRHREMPYAPAILAGVVWHELWGSVT